MNIMEVGICTLASISCSPMNIEGINIFWMTVNINLKTNILNCYYLIDLIYFKILIVFNILCEYVE